MIVLLSPTKTQKHGATASWDAPLFQPQADTILNELKEKTPAELKSFFNVSLALAHKTYDMLHDTRTTGALFLYQGEAFKALNAQTLSPCALNYAKDHLRIFSATYGLLHPYAGIQSYRLDFTTRPDLLNLWSLPVTNALNALNRPLLNCASQEFSKLIQRDQLQVPLYDIVFMTQKNKQLRILSTHSKKARGLFARYAMEHQIASLAEIKAFKEGGYTFHTQSDNEIVFIKDDDS